jgi:hypothetical protein
MPTLTSSPHRSLNRTAISSDSITGLFTYLVNQEYGKRQILDIAAIVYFSKAL